MGQFYTITELTREFGVSTRTLRYYEGEGLLSPVRKGRQRLFPAIDRTRLKLILRGKRLGFSLAEISDIIFIYDEAPGELGPLRSLISKIGVRREELHQKRRDIDLTLQDLEAIESRCHERLRAMGG
ncbi:MAG: MerR family DNA-binding transcriptional regulator [Proteobacteria bacterium]|nr:MerR family DNA-binding transcriptional regulator [Pseudomonadota bacterium]